VGFDARRRQDWGILKVDKQPASASDRPRMAGRANG
jgi:hypothetical protein